jgi:hypothetical protein
MAGVVAYGHLSGGKRSTEGISKKIRPGSQNLLPFSEYRARGVLPQAPLAQAE